MSFTARGSWLLGALLIPSLSPLPGQDAAPEALSRTIRAVSFPGRESVSLETLQGVAGLRPGALWDDAAATEAVRRLAAWPYLASVDTPIVTLREDGTVDVAIPIEERRVLGSVTFAGNDSLLSATLLVASGLRKGQPLASTTFDEAREAVALRYEEDGFLLASVEYEPIPRAGGRVDVAFFIREGRRVYVRSVRLEGASQVPASVALRAIRLQPRLFFGLLEKGYYVAPRVEEDLALLRAFYRSQGYLAAEVGFGGLELSENRADATVTFRVDEGPRFTLEEVRYEGNKLFSRAHFELDGKVATGVSYSEDEVEDGLRRLIRWYEAHADIVPEVRIRREFSGDTRVRVVYEIHEEKHYVVGRVRIADNTITRDRVIRRDVALLPGQPLRLEELETTRQRLLEDANVASAQVRTVQGDGPNVADIEVSIEERRHIGTLEVGGGADAGAGEVGYIRVHQPNLDLFRWPRSATDWEGAFQGGGQELELELIPGTKESEYRARFVEPYFFRSDFSFSITGGTAYYDRRTYSEDHIKGAAAIQKFFDRGHRLSLALGYIADAVRVHDLDDDAPADAFDVEGRTFLAYPRLELRLREASRDFFSGPRGFSGLLRLDAAGNVTGSEVDFTRALATLDWSMGFFARIPELEHVLHVGAAFGWMEGRGEPVPLYERFYLGGPRTFPGFEYRRLGPHDGKTPVGGEGDVHGVVDYSFPFLRPEVRPFAIFEWGDLEPALSQISTERFRTAVGGGLQLRFKIAGQLIPANLYWVKALASEPEDREELFSFTLGINF